MIAATALAVSGAVVSVTMSATPAAAESNVPGAPIFGTNVFYAYAEAGEMLDLSFLKDNDGTEGNDFSFEAVAPDGTVAWECTITAATPAGEGCEVADLTSDAAGAWRITAARVGDLGSTRLNWEITVSDTDGAEQSGRVWTDRYTILQDNGVLPDLSYYVVNDSGYLYDLDLLGYNGIGSTTRVNSLGLADPETCTPSYASHDGGSGLVQNCGDAFRIFFDMPSADLPATAPSVDGELTVLPLPLTEDDLAVGDLAFEPVASDSAEGTFSYSINPRFEGGYQLQIDTDGNGSYDDAVDRVAFLGADGSGSYTYAFDGLDGAGNAVPECTAMNARVYFDRVGEVHVLQNDVEGRTGGIQMIRVNGPGAPDSTIYWDDTQIDPSAHSNTTPVLDGTGGVDSTGGVHGWDFDRTSWGNNALIDDWTYAPLDLGTGEITVGSSCLTIEKSSDATEGTQVGDTVTYTLTATNSGNSDFTADAPASVSDDLSGVLDDATYNGDATADREGDLVFEGDRLSWSGALAVGESVTITYSVELVPGGDGRVRNVAFEGTPDTPTPACDPPNEDGLDPETGLACAETETLLPRLTIEKIADRTDLPAEGEAATYTVTVTNPGPGAYTADAPATMTDDLSDVLDDATFDEGSLTASVGEAGFADGTLSWTGPLEAGDAATITYSVIYTGAGDNVLLNLACIPEQQTQAGAEPCDSVQIPGDELEPALDLVKTSDTQEITEVGETITYSFLVTNTGDLTLTDVTVDEGQFSGTGELSEITCPGDAASLTPGDDVTCTATYTVTQADLDAGELENTATATGTPPNDDPIGSPPSDVTVPTVQTPALDLEKTADTEKFTKVGQKITYSFLVTNVGNITATDVTVNEGEFSGTGELSEVTCPEGAASLAPGDEVTCTAIYTVTQADLSAGDLENTATASGTPPDGGDPFSSTPSSEVVDNESPEAPVDDQPADEPASSGGSAGGGQLAATGADVAALVGLALLLITVGGVAIWRTRRNSTI